MLSNVADLTEALSAWPRTGTPSRPPGRPASAPIFADISAASVNTSWTWTDLPPPLNPQPLPFERPCDQFLHVFSTYPGFAREVHAGNVEVTFRQRDLATPMHSAKSWPHTTETASPATSRAFTSPRKGCCPVASIRIGLSCREMRSAQKSGRSLEATISVVIEVVSPRSKNLSPSVK